MKFSFEVLALAVAAGGLLPEAFGQEERTTDDPRILALAKEVHDKGWIVFSAPSGHGDADIFMMRPDGSDRRNLTNSPDFTEFAPRFSPDGRRLLYRRLPKGTEVSGSKYGVLGELVLADSDGAHARAYGKPGEYPWASWGPDGKSVACLSPKGITFVELASGQVVGTLDRKGIFQQLHWSPDGKYLAGVANIGEIWTIARLEIATGKLNPVHEFQNCTPNWFPDGTRLVFSHRPANQESGPQKGYGWTRMYMADAEGKTKTLLYGEDGVHIYGNAVSPDGKYVVFTRSREEDGDPKRLGSPMALVRVADAPTIGGESPSLRKTYPKTNDGPVLPLPVGWKPHWAFALPDASK